MQMHPHHMSTVQCHRYTSQVLLSLLTAARDSPDNTEMVVL